MKEYGKWMRSVFRSFVDNSERNKTNMKNRILMIFIAILVANCSNNKVNRYDEVISELEMWDAKYDSIGKEYETGKINQYEYYNWVLKSDRKVLELNAEMKDLIEKGEN